MKRLAIAIAFMVIMPALTLRAQDEEDRGGGFHKEKLFTGGTIALGFSTNTFQVGASPVFGYSIAPWLDAGVAANVNYTSFRNAYRFNDKLRETTYGGGVFTKIYPVRFIFVHAQFERNFITQKWIPGDGIASEKNNVQANSFLLGAGFASDRYANSGRPFFYLSLLFDVLNDDNSPYRRADGGVMPIFRGGIQVPLFQGKRR